ncbi:MAG: hypothetical protein IJX06_03175 [Clostridia bacterium]|nr:hypothetical protein [Clostridia bacterium]
MTPNKYSDRKRQEKANANSETVGVVLIIISAFLLLCLITSGLILGEIGNVISNVTLGVVGYSAYPILLAMFIVGVIKVSKKGSGANGRYVAVAIFFSIFLILIVNLATSAKYIQNGFADYIAGVYDGKDTVGGILFGLINYGLYALVGSVFSYIIYAILALGILLLAMPGIWKKKSIPGKPSRNYKTGKHDGFVASRRYDGNGNYMPAEGNPNGLFVGTIIGPETKYTRASTSFDEIEESAPVVEEKVDKDEDIAFQLDRKDIERVYGYERAKKILFEDNKAAYEKFMPASAQAEPVVKSAPVEEKASEPIIRDVPVPAPKYFEHKFVPGEITNGDEVASKLRDNEEKIKPQEEIKEKRSASYGYSTFGVKESEPTFTRGPIINGDFFEEGKDLPVVKEDTPVLEPSLISKPDITPVKSEEPVSKVENVNSGYNYSVSYEEPEEIEPEEDEYEEEIVESPAPVEYAVSYAPSVEFDEEDDEEEEAPVSFDEPEEEFIDIGEKSEENLDQFNFAPIEDTYEDFEEEIEEESDEPIQSDIIVGDDFTEEIEEDIEDEIIDGGMSSDEYQLDTPEEITEMGKNFEETTTSFKFIDEVEDASERSYVNNNDTTGYYNYVEPKPFESRVESIEKTVTPEKSQATIETFAKSEKAPEPEKPAKPKKKTKYRPPTLDLLTTESSQPESNEEDFAEKRELLEETLRELGVPATVSNVTVGPAITRYELDMPAGMSVRKVESLAPDIRYNLASKGQIRIESPIPGKRAVGVEVPNETIYTVALKDIIGSKEFKDSLSPLTIALGKDIQGNIMITKLDKMPHLLIAGSTNSGKSSCINSLLISLLYKSSPDDVKLILIDPKLVEFTPYNGLPHMMIPNAINDVGQAVNAFKWANEEMERRYVILQKNAVKDIMEYNSMPEVKEGTLPKMNYIVIVVDEFANLMISSKENQKLLEDIIMTIASKARAAGIHLVLATQRPSVNVITGTIKANLPSRIAFAVTSAQDSRIILDNNGAESLLGRGDMLFAPLDQSEETRIQGAYVTNPEIKSIVEFVKTNNPAEFDKEFETIISAKASSNSSGGGGGGMEHESVNRELFLEVVRCIMKCGMASSSLIQRRFNLGFNKAAKIMDQLEALEFVGPQNNSKPREVRVSPERFKEYFGIDYEG